MVSYDQYLNILAEKEKNPRNETEYLFLTIYFPSQSFPKNRLKKELKSFIINPLKANKKINSSPISKAIIDQVNKTVKTDP